MTYSSIKKAAFDDNILFKVGHYIEAEAGAGYFDMSLATGIFKTTTGQHTFGGHIAIASGKNLIMAGAGQFTSGTGAVALNGDITVASGKDILMQGAGEFTSGTGAVALNGDITVASGKDILMQGAGEFTSGTGAVALNGDITVASGKDILMQGAGEFTSGTGAIALNGDITVASGKDILMQGAGEFTSGTGAVALNGDVTVASGKDILMQGASEFTSGTGDVDLNGKVTVAANKELIVTTADMITEAGIIIPKYITTSVCFSGACNHDDTFFFVSNNTYQVVGIQECHVVAGDDSGAMSAMVTKCTGTEIPSGGDNLQQNVFNLKGTAATVQTATLTATTAYLQLAAGDRLGLDFTGTIDGTALQGGCITVYLKRI